MQNDNEITMNNLLLKMKEYKEIYPIIHLYSEEDLNNQGNDCFKTIGQKKTCLFCVTQEAYKLKDDCSKLEYYNEKLYHVISRYFIVDQKEYVMEMIRCLDDQLMMSQREKNSVILKYLGHHDDLYTDVLTGAYNRRFYEEKIKHQSVPAGIVMIDVDDFKIYNDTFGHDFGDVVLKAIVDIIKSNIRSTDCLIRYGGDEFLIYLPYIENKALNQKLQIILDSIHKKVIKGYESIRFSISAGVAMYQNGSIEKTVSLADHLLYHAKRQKNSIFTELDHQYYSDQNDTKQTVLVVDDSKLNREILCQILKDEFYLIEASNGEECMNYIEQYGSGISLVLLDIVMPDKDGFDVLEWMKEERWIDDIPVILISSEDSASIINKGFEMGASDYITRPFDYRIVYRRVYNMIKLYAKQKRLMDLLKVQLSK